MSVILLLLWIIVWLFFETEVCLRGWDPKVENSHFQWWFRSWLETEDWSCSAACRSSPMMLLNVLISFSLCWSPLQSRPLGRGHMQILLIYFYPFIYSLLNYMSTQIKARAFHNFILFQRIICIWPYLRMCVTYLGEIAMWLLSNWGFGIVPFPRFLVLLQCRLWWWT